MKVFVIAMIASVACFWNADAQDRPRVTGTAEFCLETAVEHTLQCEYGTMEQCQNDIKSSSNLVCVANPH